MLQQIIMLRVTMQVIILKTETLKLKRTLLEEKIKIILLKPGKKLRLLERQSSKILPLKMPPPEQITM